MAMATRYTSALSLRRSLAAGLGAGVVAAVLAAVAAQLLQRGAGRSYAELSAFQVAFVAALTNVVGGGAYALLARRTARPARWYAILALAVATLDTLMVAVAPPHPGFAALADPLHYLVAVVSLVLVPLLAGGGRPAPR